ncbi:EF-hand domain pair [Ekhidna lutea]|uniref:EF-hand domain pair n=1 Tax=Ekhidna lutea TaxID=447679 RepID=A0A239IPI1_EKHLU|nr:EF-hand domain-containing protein [Ekhidna lutea]SNS95282.1 EF-hand domain pair [Ekhidna lutea]
MGSPTTTTPRSSRSVFSETQKRKVHHLFNVLDIDRNGQLQPNDFVNVGKKIVAQLGLRERSRSGKLILLKSHRLFVQLLTDLHNPELSLTLWDWVAFFRDQIESDEPGILDHYIHRTSRHIFDLFDMNKDKLISQEEYANMLTIYNIPHKMAIQGFEELDSNSDNYISCDEMVQGLNNFFRSSDVNAKGNLIFGDWK